VCSESNSDDWSLDVYACANDDNDKVGGVDVLIGQAVGLHPRPVDKEEDDRMVHEEDDDGGLTLVGGWCE
jgi:hypothetical protein